MHYQFCVLIFIELAAITHGVSVNNLLLTRSFPGVTEYQCESPKETLLFSDHPPNCLNGHVPLSILHAKYFSTASQCEPTQVTQGLEKFMGTTPLQIARDVCGVHMSATGYYSCIDCVRSHPVPSGCYFHITSAPVGSLMMQFNATKIGSGNGAEAQIKIYDGAHGRNTLMEKITDPKMVTLTPIGSNILIELRLYSAPPPEISFSFFFKTEGKSPVNTGGCGGYIYDSGFIFSPGYPNGVRENHVCVWVFHPTPGTVPHFELLKMELSDTSGVIGDLELRDGESGADPMIAILNGTELRRFRTNGRALFVRFSSYKNSPAQGFVARFTSYA